MKVLVIEYCSGDITTPLMRVRMFGPFEDIESEEKKELIDAFLRSNIKNACCQNGAGGDCLYRDFSAIVVDLDQLNEENIASNFPQGIIFDDAKWR